MEVQPEGFYSESQNIQIVSKIGRGAQADVYLVQHKITKKQFAMKILRDKNLSEKQRSRITLQVQSNFILSDKTGQNSSFPYFYGYWPSKYGMHLLFQKCDSNVQSYSKTLLTHQQRINFSFVLLHDIIESLVVLQKNKIIHRDIKLENILIKNNKLKLADMGLARFNSRQNRLTTQIGNILSKAPQFYSGIYDYKADIWSLGINVFYLLQNTLPFDKNTKQILTQNLQQFLYIMENHQFSINLLGNMRQTNKNIVYLILQKMIVADSFTRSSAIQIKQLFFGQPLFKQQIQNLNYNSLCQNQFLYSQQQTKLSQNILFRYLLTFYLNNSSKQQGLLSLATILAVFQFIKASKKVFLQNPKSQKIIEQNKKSSAKNVICSTIQQYVLKTLIKLSEYFNKQDDINAPLIYTILQNIVSSFQNYFLELVSCKKIESSNNLDSKVKHIKKSRKNNQIIKSLRQIQQNEPYTSQNEINTEEFLKIYSIKKVRQKFPLLEHLIQHVNILLDPIRQSSSISQICLWKMPIDIKKLYSIS